MLSVVAGYLAREHEEEREGAGNDSDKLKTVNSPLNYEEHFAPVFDHMNHFQSYSFSYRFSFDVADQVARKAEDHGRGVMTVLLGNDGLG